MKRLALFLTVVLILVLSGCMNLPTFTGKLTVYLTDAVLPISSVQKLDVTIDTIRLMSDTEDASVVVTNEATTVNLLDLIGSEMSFGTIETSGSFTQLRFEISQATITVNNEEYELKISSSSLKYPFTEPLVISADTTLILDFDLSNSIKVVGSGDNPSEFHMTPVIHLRHGHLYDVIGRVVNDTDGVPSALVALFDTNESTVVAATFTHRDSNKWQAGEFKFCKIEPGDYEIRVFLKETYQNWSNSSGVLTATPDATKAVTVDYKEVNVGDIVTQNQ